MDFVTDYGLFLAKIITVLLSFGVLIALIAGASRAKPKDKGHIEVTSLSEKLKKNEDTFAESILPPHEKKSAIKERKKRDKLSAKKTTKDIAESQGGRTFVLNFHGDLRASAVAALREEITAILAQVKSDDEVVVKLESSGGMVHSYGLAASQLDRIRKQNISLTICVDKVAASGGYMMACVADKVVAAPFAIIGSIGVVAQIPNINRLLKRHDVDVELITAGKYKRTLTVLGENTEEGRDKFRQDMEDIHDLFKEYVAERRQKLDIEEVATGEIWYGSRAQQIGLVDDIKTSDEYLTALAKDSSVFEVHYIEKKTLPEKFGIAVEETSDRLLVRWINRLSKSHHYF
ncbi:MAG: protease SohB [Gammaproteobacteria bacterium]|nr:MAG: protease SohB [Gammaproteobacteria bacterium]